jgi:hypothetical protein
MSCIECILKDVLSEHFQVSKINYRFFGGGNIEGG